MRSAPLSQVRNKTKHTQSFGTELIGIQAIEKSISQSQALIQTRRGADWTYITHIRMKRFLPSIALHHFKPYPQNTLDTLRYRSLASLAMASVETTQSTQTSQSVQSLQPPANIKKSSHPQHHVATRQPSSSTGDFDNAYPLEVRKYLRTYGMVPPVVDTHENQIRRCTMLEDSLPSPSQLLTSVPQASSS